MVHVPAVVRASEESKKSESGFGCTRVYRLWSLGRRFGGKRIGKDVYNG
jgi:hypothetical protein